MHFHHLLHARPAHPRRTVPSSLFILLMSQQIPQHRTVERPAPRVEPARADERAQHALDEMLGRRRGRDERNRNSGRTISEILSQSRVVRGPVSLRQASMTDISIIRNCVCDIAMATSGSSASLRRALSGRFFFKKGGYRIDVKSHLETKFGISFAMRCSLSHRGASVNKFNQADRRVRSRVGCIVRGGNVDV